MLIELTFERFLAETGAKVHRDDHERWRLDFPNGWSIVSAPNANLWEAFNQALTFALEPLAQGPAEVAPDA